MFPKQHLFLFNFQTTVHYALPGQKLGNGRLSNNVNCQEMLVFERIYFVVNFSVMKSYKKNNPELYELWANTSCLFLAVYTLKKTVDAIHAHIW